MTFIGMICAIHLRVAALWLVWTCEHSNNCSDIRPFRWWCVTATCRNLTNSQPLKRYVPLKVNITPPLPPSIQKVVTRKRVSQDEMAISKQEGAERYPDLPRSQN